MCRATYEGGRRCPGCTDPHRIKLANIRQRIGRHHKAAHTAGQREDWAAVEKYVDLLDRAVADYEHATSVPTAPTAPAAPAPPPTRAAEFTPQATLDWSDDELAAALNSLHHDPAAQEQILATLDWREDVDRQRDAEIAEMQEQKRRAQAEREAAWARAADDESPLTNPARRASRRLTPEQACREEYDANTYIAYLAAENECRGVLLSREGRAKDIDPITLFSGPAARARKYASEELKTWWARNGRITYTEWRYQWFGRESDRVAARTARHQSLGEAAA